jgi:hypothetical protein
MRISMLLLQLLCLLPMAAVWADREGAVYSVRQTEPSDHQNLRVATSSTTGYLDSFTDALYSLLRTLGLHNEPSPSDVNIGEEDYTSLSVTEVTEFSDGRQRDYESSREGRRLANKKRLNMKRQQATGSRTANMQWCEFFPTWLLANLYS